MRTVLVIDDSPAVITALELLFRLHDIRTLSAATPAKGLEQLSCERVDLVIADMNFSADTTSGDEGAQLFRAIRTENPDLPVILLTAWTHLETAVQLIKAGAADYIAKPWDNDKLLTTIENLLELAESTRERARLQRERSRRREQLASQYDLQGVIFESASMEAAVELACRVARAPVPVLLTGPNGAGKERIAAIVHANSAVREGPFVAVNCGALPSELIEAELFGAEAGAYTGANKARAGRFESANGGTLFLDEIGNLPLSGQVKLLRVLETGQFEQLGSSRTRSTRVRVISATNSDLPAMIRDARFREDLYYRLNVIEISLPPLAERMDDVLPLAEHFLGQGLRLSDEARAKLLARDHIVQVADLNLTPVRAADTGIGREADSLSRELLEDRLRQAGGNVSRAAQSLGLSRQAFYRRMQRFGLRTPGGA
jgi:DNA-binding NtrC family response regulator